MEKANHWPRMIALVDMDCFFAQIEQQDNPKWRDKPVAVTNGEQGTTIITSSYEARAYGIKTGMKLYDARALYPDLIQAPSRPQRYAALSTQIMAALHTITPDVEVYSVDEAFLDITHCQLLYQGAHDVGQRIKRVVKEASGLNCSVGISGDKTTAKFAAKQGKPDGLYSIHPDEAATRLSYEKVTALSGVNRGIAGFLARYNIHYCGQMSTIPMSVLAQRFGNIGRRIWLMAQGLDPDPIQTHVKAPKTIGHGKVLPPKSNDKYVILTYFQHMSEKVAARMRLFNYKAGQFFIGAKTPQGWLAYKQHLGFHTDDGRVIYQLCVALVEQIWEGQTVKQVQVTALSPQESRQLDLFLSDMPKRQRSNQAIDIVNQRYGELTLAPARLLNKSSMPNVIAPAWQPKGLRKTI